MNKSDQENQTTKLQNRISYLAVSSKDQTEKLQAKK